MSSSLQHPMMESTTCITPLADVPELIPLVAQWQHAEWGNFVGARTLEQRKARLQQHLERDAMPMTVVAWHNNEPVGCASLIANDMPALSAWIPWLSALYVLPEHRCQGIGSRLVEQIAAEARKLGYPRLYLYTLDQMSFYAARGWQTSHIRHYRAHDMTVMARDLVVHPPQLMATPATMSA